MDNRDTQRQKFLRRDGKPGQELPDITQAQSEIYGIQGEMQNNLKTQRMLHQSRMQNRQILQQAAGMALMGQGGGQPMVMPQRRTDNSILQQYGIGKPGQTSKTTNQAQTIQSGPSKIENRYITTTKNDIRIVQPQIPITQPTIPMSQGGGGNNTAKFQAWLSSLFAKQQVEDAKQEKEYNRREWNLQRTANKMLSKMTNLTRGFAEKINPQNMASTLGNQLKLFGVMFLTYLAGKYWTPLMKKIDEVEAGFRIAFGLDMTNYAGTGVGDKGKSIVGQIKSFLGIDPNDTRKTLLGGIKDIFDSGTQKLLDGLKLLFKDRAEAVKSIKLPDFSGANKMKIGPFNVDLSGINGVLQSGIGYLGDILTVLIGGSAGAVKNSAKKIMNQGSVDLAKVSQGEGFSKTRNTDVFGNLKTDANSTYLASKSVGMALNDKSGTAYTGAVASGLSQLAGAANRAGSVVVSREMLIDAGFGPYLDRLYRSGDLKEEKVKIIQVAKNKEDQDNSTGNINVSKATALGLGSDIFSAVTAWNPALSTAGQIVGYGAKATAAVGAVANDWYRDEVVPVNSNRVGDDGKPGRIATVYRITKNGFKTLQQLGNINSFDIEDESYLNFVKGIVERKKKQNGIVGNLAPDQEKNFQTLRDTQARASQFHDEVEAWRTNPKYAPFNNFMQNTGSAISMASNWVGNKISYAGNIIRGAENSSILALITGGKQFRVSGKFGADRSWNRSAAQRAAGNTKHQGIDIACPVGTPICAPESGNITAAESSNGKTAGRFVQMVSDDGKRKYFMCHLQVVYVKAGQHVQQGEVLGLSGASGHGKDNAYAAHLHLQTGYTDQKGTYGNGWVDPLGFVTSNSQIIPAPQVPDNQIPSVSNVSLDTGKFAIASSDALVLGEAAQNNGASGIAETAKSFNPGNYKGSAFAKVGSQDKSGSHGHAMFENWVDGYAGCGYQLLRYVSGQTNYMKRNPTVKEVYDVWTGNHDEEHLLNVCKYSGLNPGDHVPVEFSSILVLLLAIGKFDSGHCNVEEAKKGLQMAWDKWLSEGGEPDTSETMKAASELWGQVRNVTGSLVQDAGQSLQESGNVFGNFFNWLGGGNNAADPVALRQASKESRESEYQKIMRQNSEAFMEKAYGAKKDSYGMYIERGNSKIYLREGTNSTTLTADDVKAVNVRANADSGWKEPKDDTIRNKAINEVISNIDDLYTYNEKGTSSDVLLNADGKPAVFDLGYYTDIGAAGEFPGFTGDAVRIYGSKGIHYMVSFSKDGKRLRRILTDEIELSGLITSTPYNNVSHTGYLDSAHTYSNTRKRLQKTTPYLYQKGGFKDGNGKVYDWNPIYVAIGVAPMLTPLAQKDLDKLQGMLNNASFHKMSNNLGWNSLKNNITGKDYNYEDLKFAQEHGLINGEIQRTGYVDSKTGKTVTGAAFKGTTQIQSIDNLKRTISIEGITKQLGISGKLTKEAMEEEYKAHPENYKLVGNELYDIKSGIKVGDVSGSGDLTVLTPSQLKSWVEKHSTEIEDNKQKFQKEISAQLYQENGVFNPDLIKSSFANVAAESKITSKKYQDVINSDSTKFQHTLYEVPIGGMMCDIKLDETGTKIKAIRYHLYEGGKKLHRADGTAINNIYGKDLSKWSTYSDKDKKFTGFDTAITDITDKNGQARAVDISQGLKDQMASLSAGNGLTGDSSQIQKHNAYLKNYQFTFKTGAEMAQDKAFQKTLKELQDQYKKDKNDFVSGTDGIIWDKDYTMPIGKMGSDGRLQLFSAKQAGFTAADYEVGGKSRKDVYWWQKFGATETETGEWAVYSKDGKTRLILKEDASQDPNASLEDVEKRIEVFTDGKWQNARNVKTWTGRANTIGNGYDTEVQDRRKEELAKLTNEINSSGTSAVDRVFSGISNLAGGNVSTFIEQAAKYNNQFLSQEQLQHQRAEIDKYLLELQEKEAEGISKMANAYDSATQSLVVTDSNDIKDQQEKRIKENKNSALKSLADKISKDFGDSRKNEVAGYVAAVLPTLIAQYGEITNDDLTSNGINIDRGFIYDDGTSVPYINGGDSTNGKDLLIRNPWGKSHRTSGKNATSSITSVGGKPVTPSSITIDKKPVSNSNPVPTKKTSKDEKKEEEHAKAIVKAVTETGNNTSKTLADNNTMLKTTSEAVIAMSRVICKTEEQPTFDTNIPSWASIDQNRRPAAGGSITK